jgi:hypothetical protein
MLSHGKEILDAFIGSTQIGQFVAWDGHLLILETNMVIFLR